MAQKKVSLPKGFTSIGGQGETWRPTKRGASITGTLAGVRVVKVERKRGGKLVKEPCKVYTVRDSDGGEIQLWQSAGLRAMERVKKGQKVFIRFDGMGKAKKGQNAPKLYTVAVAK